MISRWPHLATAVALFAATCSQACLKVPGTEDSAAPTAPQNGIEIVKRHVAALGGEEALRKIHQRTVEARVVFHPMEGCESGQDGCVTESQSGQFVLYNTASGLMFRRMVVGEVIHERGYDGKIGWQLQLEPRMLVLDDEASAALSREDAVLHWYLEFASRGIEPEILASRRDTDSGMELDGIRWRDTASLLPARELWFDRATGLLREEIERDTETHDTVRRIHENYLPEDGAQVARRLVQISESAGVKQRIELTIQSVKHNPIDASQFKIPELGPIEARPDELLKQLAQARLDAEAENSEARVHVALARISFAAAHFDEARAAAQRALALDRTEPEAAWISARVDLLQGKLGAARKGLARAQQSGVAREQIARQLAWISMRQRDWAAAAKYLEAAGEPVLASRYAAFAGRPLTLKISKNACSVTLPFDGDKTLPIVRARSGAHELRLLIDTGAADAILSEETARRIGVTAETEAPLTAGGAPVPHGQITSLSFGDVTLARVPVVLFSSATLEQMVGDKTIDGVVGMRTLTNLQLTIDRVAGSLELVEPHARCKSALARNRVGTPVPTVLHETHYVYVLATMNGAEGVYLLNSGMRGAALTANDLAFAHAGIGAPPIRPGQPVMVKVNSLRVGDWEKHGLNAAYGYLTQNATSDGFRLDGMIGLDALGSRWTLDPMTQALYISDRASVGSQ